MKMQWTAKDADTREVISGPHEFEAGTDPTGQAFSRALEMMFEDRRALPITMVAIQQVDDEITEYRVVE